MKRVNKIIVRIPKTLLDSIHNDLDRPHDHAYERGGFITCSLHDISDNAYVIVMTDYHPIADEHYIEDHTVGAHLSSEAIYIARRKVINEGVGQFHVHRHDHSGVPNFSITDLSGIGPVTKSFIERSKQAHGMLLLSKNSINCQIWLPGVDKALSPDQITIVGEPMRFRFPNIAPFGNSSIYERQSFLGEYSDYFLQNVRVGVVGLGGGGSHIVQQLAHLGVKKYNVFDADIMEDTNLNRLIGGVKSDVGKTFKSLIAQRVIKGIIPDAEVNCITDVWEKNPERLHECDIIFGCIDSIIGRRDLEAECRRYLIPLIDIGMGVHKTSGGQFDIRGQIILSMPGELCMQCYGFITENNLKEEADRYGDAGTNPQVVWSNGVLASTAIGIFVKLVTNWKSGSKIKRYIAYNGNDFSLSEHRRGQYPLNTSCMHYPINEAGEPRWTTF